MKRYTIHILFKTSLFETPQSMKQDVKTLREAQEFKSLLDDTVCSMWIEDKVMNKVEYLKG